MRRGGQQTRTNPRSDTWFQVILVQLVANPELISRSLQVPDVPGVHSRGRSRVVGTRMERGWWCGHLGRGDPGQGGRSGSPGQVRDTPIPQESSSRNGYQHIIIVIMVVVVAIRYILTVPSKYRWPWSRSSVFLDVRKGIVVRKLDESAIQL